MLRVFIALKIPQYIQEEIIINCKKACPEHKNYKWEAQNKLHVTLKFIGNVEEDDLEKIIKSLSFLSNYKILNCSLNNFGFFFRNKEPKILWVDIKTDQVIFNLVDDINNALEKFSIDKDNRKFKPHITLLRIKQKLPKKFVESFANFKVPEIKFSANEIALIESKLMPKGSVYKDLKIYNLI